MRNQVNTDEKIKEKANYTIFTEPGKTIKKSKIIRIDLFNDFKLHMVKEIYTLENWRIKKDSGHSNEGYSRVYLEII